MFDNSTNLVIVFNGEIYNYKELKANLSKKYVFYSSSDTSTSKSIRLLERRLLKLFEWHVCFYNF